MTAATEALAGFLSAIDFTHFCTFTTRKPVSVAGMRRVAENVARHIDAGNTATMFWAAEKFDALDGMKSTAQLRYPDQVSGDYTTSRYHFHALLKTPIHPVDLFGWYQPRYGRCQIIDNTNHDTRHSAAFYCAKYITKTLADYDIYFAQEIKQRGQLSLYKTLGDFDKFN